MAVNITNVTSGVIGGTGNFDKLMAVAKLHLHEEYAKQRITGDKYAEAYIAIMREVLAQAIQFSIQEESTNRASELTAEQKALIVQQTKSEKAKIVDTIDNHPVVGSVGKQKAVYDAQIKAFKDKTTYDTFKALLDVWNVQRSTDSGIQPTLDTLLYNNNIGSAVTAMFGAAGIAVNPLSDVGTLNATVDKGSGVIAATGCIGIGSVANTLAAAIHHNMSGGVHETIPMHNLYIDSSNNFTVSASDVYAKIHAGDFYVVVTYTNAHGQHNELKQKFTK